MSKLAKLRRKSCIRTSLKTTQRYAHLSQDTLLAASNAATLAVGSVMGAMPNRVLDVPLVAALG